MIVSHPAPDVPAALREQVRRLHRLAWGDDSEHDPALRPRSLLLVEDATVLAALDVLRAALEHAGRSWDAVGLSTVVTDPDRRGQGHGRRLVRAAHDTMRGLGADLAVFTCDRPLAGFYVAAGFEVLAGSVLVGGTRAVPFPSDAPGFDKVVLAAFLSPAARAARAAFLGARIGLYPGEVDRLW